MKPAAPSFRSAIAKARGLGAAHNGTHHWMMQRVTAVVLIPLIVYVIIGFLNHVVFGGYNGAVAWLQSPIAATLAIFMVLAGLRHGTIGLQVVIEDYVHCSLSKTALIFAVNVAGVALAILGTLSVAKVYFAV